MRTCHSIVGMKLEVEYMGSNSRNKKTRLYKTLTRTMHHFPFETFPKLDYC